jgi:microcystin-dependent protein
MGKVIGIDIGGSTTKIVGFDDKTMISPLLVRANDPIASVYGAFGKFLNIHSLKIEEGGLATSYLSPMQPIIDSNLTTSNKYVIGAINELLAYIGTLSNLNTVNKTNLVNALNELNKAGKVEWFAMNSVPTGYLRCNGTAVSRTTYARLFSAIGTVFGTGDSSTTFNIPDLRGVVIRGYDDGRGLDVGRVFGSYQSDDFKSHCHTQSTGGNLTTVAPSGGSGIIGQSNSTETSYVGGVETRMKNVALLPCIRY